MSLLICLVATYYIREGAAQDINTTFVSIDCCEILHVLTTYTVQSTGDKVDLRLCVNHECLTLQVVQLFINPTIVGKMNQTVLFLQTCGKFD